MTITILIIVAALVLIFIIIAALQPTNYRVVRKTNVFAPPAVPFAQVNDLHRWQEVSPWAKLDPAATNTYSGPASGTGAIFNWSGNKKIGEGQMTIMDSRPNELVRFKLDFVRPFASTAIAEFTFKPEGNQTEVVWALTGQNNLVSKAFGLFVNMDKMIGSDFEKGLASLKSLSEAKAKLK